MLENPSQKVRVPRFELIHEISIIINWLLVNNYELSSINITSIFSGDQ